MAVVNYAGRIKSASYTTTDPITSDDFLTDGNVDRITFLVYSTKAGTAQVKYKPLGGETAVNYGSGVAVGAATLEAIVINHALPNAHIVFTPGSATTDTMWIDAFSGTLGKGRR